MLSQYYQSADVFVLPSKSETWGLVVEEALNNGLPVMVSEKVGCASEIVTPDRGLIFSLNKEDFEQKLSAICSLDFYNTLRKNISTMSFEEIENEQVNCYL